MTASIRSTGSTRRLARALPGWLAAGGLLAGLAWSTPDLAEAAAARPRPGSAGTYGRPNTAGTYGRPSRPPSPYDDPDSGGQGGLGLLGGVLVRPVKQANSYGLGLVTWPLGGQKLSPALAIEGNVLMPLGVLGGRFHAEGTGLFGLVLPRLGPLHLSVLTGGTVSAGWREASLIQYADAYLVATVPTTAWVALHHEGFNLALMARHGLGLVSLLGGPPARTSPRAPTCPTRSWGSA